MRIFNKVATVVFLVMLIGAIFVLALQPLDSIDSLQSIANDLEDIDITGRVIGALAIDLVLLGLLFLEFRRGPQSAHVARTRRGEGEVSLDAVEQRIIQTVSELESVKEVKPTISTKRKRVVVSVEVITTPEVNIPKKLDEVAMTVRKTVTDGMGLKLQGKPSVVIRHTS